MFWCCVFVFLFASFLSEHLELKKNRKNERQLELQKIKVTSFYIIHKFVTVWSINKRPINILHIVHGFESDISEYLRRGDRKTLECYAEVTGWKNTPRLSCHQGPDILDCCPCKHICLSFGSFSFKPDAIHMQIIACEEKDIIVSLNLLNRQNWAMYPLILLSVHVVCPLFILWAFICSHWYILKNGCHYFIIYECVLFLV